MPFIGSSNIPVNLVSSGSFSYVTGPTGNTGADGPTGPEIIGPTGNDGIQFSKFELNGYTLNINYGNIQFSVPVTAASGSLTRPTLSNFVVNLTGSSEIDSYSLFGGYTTDSYKLLFKSIKVTGEATVGISLDSIYILSSSLPNTNIGATGSLLYINENSEIVPTNDVNTKYEEKIVTPVSGSLYGITLETFSYKQIRDLTSIFSDSGEYTNLNFINGNRVVLINNDVDVTYSTFTNSKQNSNRTDQGLFTIICDNNKNIYPRISFRSEGITLLQSGATITGPIQVDILGKGITYSSAVYKPLTVGSCCFCSKSDNVEQNTVETTCLDYSTQEFCNSINGNFSFKSCNYRYLSGDCYSGGSCCVNGVCIETNKEFCEKIYGIFYSNIKCKDLEFGCPNICPTTASCCVNGICYSLNNSESSVDLCNELNGTYSDISCDERNCCVEGFLGACCFGTECKDEYNAEQCTKENGVFQGPGSFCSSTECCKDSVYNPYTASSTDIPQNIKVGDIFGGGIVAGFIGYPPPLGFDPSDIFAKGEVISEIENYISTSVKKYVAVNGVYDNSLKCNCSKSSPSRYININDLGMNHGKLFESNIKNLSGVRDKLDLTFYNRLSDICLENSGKPCNEKTTQNKKYGFNSIQAYKKQAISIHGNNIPNAWILIVAPEDFGKYDLSFGMSMSINGFDIPEKFKNYSNELWQNNILTPYGTTVFDGLVNTRMFDETSIQRNNWFIPDNYIIDGISQKLDPLAYDRFKHKKQSYWRPGIDVNTLSRNSEYFKSEYEKMWKTINTENTALFNISNSNNQSYNGYSDWYIPSALELNVIFNNIEKINNSIIYNATNSWKTLSTESRYWTSTTGGKLVTVKSLLDEGIDAKLYDSYNYNLEGNFSNGEFLSDSWKQYKAALAHRAYVQDFSTGKMVSYFKSEKMAKLRACRMIPIYFKEQNLNNQFEYSFQTLNSCLNCRR